jgi:YebC/PmpR family DNA-binding regulatory protein
MSGHSKWATIKRKKAATDQARGRQFSQAIKEVTIAARQGGGDPESNARLRTAISAAKAVNMPASNIERAIKRGTGEIEGANYEEAHYEGYAPGGVAIMVEVATDNRNRTAGEIRHLFTRFGGSLAEAGAVSYLFKTRGVILVDVKAVAEDALIEIVLEAGGDDVVPGAGVHEIYAEPARLESVREALTAKQIPIQSAELTKISSVMVDLPVSNVESVLRLVEALEEHEDVQKVYANLNVPDEVLARMAH